MLDASRPNLEKRMRAFSFPPEMLTPRLTQHEFLINDYYKPGECFFLVRACVRNALQWLFLCVRNASVLPSQIQICGWPFSVLTWILFPDLSL